MERRESEPAGDQSPAVQDEPGADAPADAEPAAALDAGPISPGARVEPTALSRGDMYPGQQLPGRAAGAGLLSRVGDWVRSVTRSEAERRELALDEQLARTKAMTRPNTIAVVSPKGGVGKTSLSFVLGNLLADQLHLRVVALDVNPDFGTLASLAGDDHRSPRSLADLLADSPRVRSPAELHPYVSRLPSGLHVIGAPIHAEVMAQVTPSLYGRLVDFLESFYEVVILDLGSGVTGPLTRFAVGRADQTLLVTTPEWVTASSALRALRHLRLQDGSVVINQAPAGRRAAQRDAVVDHFRSHGITTRATIPHDERLHAMLDSGTYTFADLEPSTRVPVKELAAAVAARFV